VIVKMIVEKQRECRLAGETEVLGEKTCPSATFVQTFTLTRQFEDAFGSTLNNSINVNAK
jgi:hypothetical protein